jgi:hypothetical protein
MKTINELEGAELDAAVSKADGCGEGVVIPYSTEWEWGGPLIEREHIKLAPFSETYWEAVVYDFKTDVEKSGRWPGRGPTPLIAAMRAFVASRQKLPLSVIDTMAERGRAAGMEPLNIRKEPK